MTEKSNEYENKVKQGGIKLGKLKVRVYKIIYTKFTNSYHTVANHK